MGEGGVQANQTAMEFTSTRTSFLFQCFTVNVNATFLTPIVVSNSSEDILFSNTRSWLIKQLFLYAGTRFDPPIHALLLFLHAGRG